MGDEFLSGQKTTWPVANWKVSQNSTQRVENSINQKDFIPIWAGFIQPGYYGADLPSWFRTIEIFLYNIHHPPKKIYISAAGRKKSISKIVLSG